MKESGKTKKVKKFVNRKNLIYAIIAFINVIGLYMIILIVRDVREHEFDYKAENINKILNIDHLLFMALILFFCFMAGILVIVFQAYRLMRRNAKLQNANAMNEVKNKFLSHISHEIRTPMNAIIGMAEIAKHSLEEKEKLENSLNNICTASHYLLHVINDILDMSKIENENLELDRDIFTMSEMLQVVNCVIFPNVNAQDIKLNILKTGPMEDLICADKKRTGQILINILSNAIKYTKEDGESRIRFAIKTAVTPDKKLNAIFEISDNGIGINKENLEKIFKPFEQAENQINHGGSGLGLAISKGYLDMMGGMISVNSQSGLGSEFVVKISFPLASEEEKKAHQDKLLKEMAIKTKIGKNAGRLSKGMSSMERKPGGKVKRIGRVLLVDDNEMNIEVMISMLDYYGYEVVIAKNGQEAVDIFRGSKILEFKCILMDIQMPVMGGLEASVEIRKLDRKDAQSVKIIALTANAFKEDIDKSKEAGMDLHITKPIVISKVIELLNTIHGV